jgi:hypothetical protein
MVRQAEETPDQHGITWRLLPGFEVSTPLFEELCILLDARWRAIQSNSTEAFIFPTDAQLRAASDGSRLVSARLHDVVSEIVEELRSDFPEAASMSCERLTNGIIAVLEHNGQVERTRRGRLMILDLIDEFHCTQGE